jgi:hypothetical protein
MDFSERGSWSGLTFEYFKMKYALGKCSNVKPDP